MTEQTKTPEEITFNVGDKVTYDPDFGVPEKGIVKSFSEPDHVFVVYNWAREPENYNHYTGVRTLKRNLRKGWGS